MDYGNTKVTSCTKSKSVSLHNAEIGHYTEEDDDKEDEEEDPFAKQRAK